MTRPITLTAALRCELEKNTKMFLYYLPQNPVDSDKIRYTLS